jgi:membrane protein implicated in regulation of membrane protease activity
MLTFYIIAAIVGGGLVIVSALFGGETDHSVEHDAPGDLGSSDVDVHHGHDFHMSEVLHWVPFLSLRFWTYFLMSFGLIGVILRLATDVPEPMTAWLAAGSGFAIGLSAMVLLRLAAKMEGDSSTRTEDLLGVQAKVVVTVRPDQMGKVRCRVKGDTLEFLALAHEEQTMEPGEDVVIVAIENDRARVVPLASIYG